jgi:hypothetical protein
MATKKTTTKSKKAPAKKAPAKKAAPKKEKAAAGEAKAALPRHPKGRVVAKHESKEALAKSLAEAVAREDEDTGVIAERLRTASNSQLLRLQAAVDTVKEKYGSREKLIAKIGAFENKAKDKDYLAALDALSLPNLLDLAKHHERRARA